MTVQTTRVVTPVSWAFAPPWVTVQQACELSGHDGDTMRWMMQDGAVDTKEIGGETLIEKWSLHEYQEALAEVLHWYE